MSARDPAHMLNWRRVSARVTCSGQPDAAQLDDIRKLDVAHIVNLGPNSNKGALRGEADIVDALGMQYHYIPVDFDAPSDADFDTFCQAMAQIADDPVHIHCIYNARVTAFLLRYADSGLGDETPASAAARMDGIWRPGSVWLRFLGQDPAPDLPNRYKGYNYA